MQPEISIVVPTYNKAAHLRRLLPSIIEQRFDPSRFEIIIVDDGSCDETAEVVRQFSTLAPGVQYIYQSNKGIGAARNPGLRRARGDLICFLADDYVLDPHYLEKMTAVFADKTVHGLRPRFSSLGDSLVEMSFQLFLRGAFDEKNDPEVQKIYRSPKPISWGGASITRRQVFETFGLFGEKYRIGEDTEYAWRLAAAGIHIHIYDEVLFKIKNRAKLFEASYRLYQYAFTGQWLAAELSHFNRFPTTQQKRSLISLLAWVFAEPAVKVFRHNRSPFRAVLMLPIVYWMIVMRLVGGLARPLVRQGAVCMIGLPSFARSMLRSYSGKPSVLLLVQFHNEMGRLPDFFLNVLPHVDGIIGLDDGSSDGSGDYFRLQPKVLSALHRPIRHPHHWDEPANRRALIEASHRYRPDWLLALDVDERLEKNFREQAELWIGLSTLTGRNTLSLKLLELWDSETQYRVDGIWGTKRRNRLFRWSPTHLTSEMAFHGPWTSVAPGSKPKVLRTDLRIYHLGTMTENLREKRVEKYQRLDPHRRYQAIGYEYLNCKKNLRLAHIEPDRDYRLRADDVARGLD